MKSKRLREVVGAIADVLGVFRMLAWLWDAFCHQTPLLASLNALAGRAIKQVTRLRLEFEAHFGSDLGSKLLGSLDRNERLV